MLKREVAVALGSKLEFYKRYWLFFSVVVIFLLMSCSFDGLVSISVLFSLDNVLGVAVLCSKRHQPRLLRIVNDIENRRHYVDIKWTLGVYFALAESHDSKI